MEKVMLIYVVCACLLYGRAQIPDENHISPCYENENNKHDCKTDKIACLPNSEGTLLSVCANEVVKIVYYLSGGESVQAVEREIVINITSTVYSIISTLMVELDINREAEGILKEIEPYGCNDVLAPKLCNEDVDLILTCLPDPLTCDIMNYTCIKAKYVIVSFKIYDDHKNQIVDKHVNVNTGWKYYYFFSKLLCDYEKFNIIPKYNRQYRIFLLPNDSVSQSISLDKSDAFLQRITDGIIGFCMCLCITLVVRFSCWVRRSRRKNQHQPVNNNANSDYLEKSYSENNDTTFKEDNDQVQQDLHFRIGSTSA